MQEALPKAVDQFGTRHGAAIHRLQGERAQFAQIQTQRPHVYFFVGANPLHQFGCEFGLGTAVGEQSRRSEGFLGGGEANFGAKLDEQQVHQKAQRHLKGHFELRHVALIRFRSGDAARGFDIWMRVGAEG